MQPAGTNRHRRCTFGEPSRAVDELDALSVPVSLPRWWRRALVALATLILCSCQALPPAILELESLGDVAAGAPGSMAVVTDQDGPQLPAGRPQTEIRSLDPEILQWSRPLDPALAASYSCGCGSHGSAGGACDIGALGAASSGAVEGLVGPADEYLCDGGDFGLPAAVRADWSVDGLEQEDAVAHYDTLDGRVVVTPSNRVCVYAPRFAAVRRVENLLAHERRQLIDIAADGAALAGAKEAQPVATSTQRHAVATNLGERPPILFRARQQPGETVNPLAPMDSFNSLAPYANLEIIRTGQVDGSEEPLVAKAVQSAIAWTGDQAVQVVIENKQAVALLGLKQPGIVYQTSEPNSPWLRLLKLASTHHALPGEEVEFTLRFDNIGDQVIGNVTIVDNLATRLEYVPNSARSSLAANFSAVPNGAGSTVLRWEITEPVEAGQGGILQFRALVR